MSDNQPTHDANDTIAPDQMSILVKGLRDAICDPKCPVQFSPLLMECAQVLAGIMREQAGTKKIRDALDKMAEAHPIRAVADLEAENQELRVLLADERAAHRVCVEMRDEAERKKAEIERLRERCLAYKGQVEAGSIAIQHLQGEIARMRDALEQAVSDFGDSHCVCEDTKQMCIAALLPSG